MSLKSPWVIIGLVLAATGSTQIYFVLPKVAAASFDIAAAQWFVFCPLYLFVKRKWTMLHLSAGQQLVLDGSTVLAVHASLAWIALSSPPESMSRVLAVWLCCAILSFVTFRAGPGE